MHHINGNKLDNHLENLHYMSRSQHMKLHKIGKKRSEQTKAKLRAAHKGKKHSEQTKQKISTACKGKKLSEEHKAKLKAAANKKPVYCLQLNKVFESATAAAIELSLHHQHISKCCKGKLKTTRKITF